MPDLDTYTFDFDDLVDAVSPLQTDGQSSIINSQSTYDLQGRPVQTTVKGHIYIRNHQKVIEQ